jgi:hypothetical protein
MAGPGAQHSPGARGVEPHQERSIDVKALVITDEGAQDVRLSSEPARLPAIQIGADEVGGPERCPVKRENGDFAHREAVHSQ